ncbi:MAG: hypothetical protein ACI93R_001993 [Flavobacteriales bacterium]|jgi:hypothetical protein
MQWVRMAYLTSSIGLITVITKLLIKVAIMMGLLIGISSFLVYKKTGKSPLGSLSIPELSLSGLRNIAGESIQDLDTRSEQTYKWRDADGILHYSSEKPTDTTTYKLLNIDPNTNMIQGLPTSSLSSSDPQQDSNTLPSTDTGTGTGKYSDIIEDAKNIQNLLDKRFEEQEKALNYH